MSTTSPPGSGNSDGRRRRAPSDRARLVAIGILAVVAILFAVLNFDEVKVHLLFGTAKLPLILVIVICLLAGMVFGWFLTRRQASRRRSA